MKPDAAHLKCFMLNYDSISHSEKYICVSHSAVDRDVARPGIGDTLEDAGLKHAALYMHIIIE